MSAAITLDTATVEAIAQRTAELLRGECVAPELLDAGAVANRLNVSRDYIYQRADELGAVRLGDGPRARLRFDLATVSERLAARPDPRTKPAPPKSSTPRRRRRPSASDEVELLPVRGDR